MSKLQSALVNGSCSDLKGQGQIYCVIWSLKQAQSPSSITTFQDMLKKRRIETAETAVLCSTWLCLGDISGTLADVLLISGMIMRRLQLEAF